MSDDFKNSSTQLNLSLAPPKANLRLITSNNDCSKSKEKTSCSDKKLHENALSRVNASGVFNLRTK